MLPNLARLESLTFAHHGYVAPNAMQHAKLIINRWGMDVLGHGVQKTNMRQIRVELSDGNILVI